MTRMKSWKDAEKSMIAHATDGPRRTKPANVGCPSVEDFHEIYNEGRKVIQHDSVEWRGPTSYKKMQSSQDPVAQKAPGYDNQTSGWLRGQGPREGGLRPGYDRMPKAPSGRAHGPNPLKGEPSRASGKDI